MDNCFKKGLRKKLPACPINNAYLGPDGVPTMTFPTAEARDKAAETLKLDYKVKTRSQIPKKLAPKVKILGVSVDVISDSDKNITEELKSKNPVIDELVSDGEEFKIIYKNKADNLIVIRTTRKIKESLRRANDKIYCGLQILRVRDHVHPVQCFHC